MLANLSTCVDNVAFYLHKFFARCPTNGPLFAALLFVSRSRPSIRCRFRKSLTIVLPPRLCPSFPPQLYYDNRYWTMWKLPMFGCRDPMQVLREIVACTKAFPDAYVRLVAFDNVKQVQIMGFLVQRPKSARDWQPVNRRSV